MGKGWMLSSHPEIFDSNPDLARIVPDEWRVEKLCSLLGKKPTTLSYGRWIGDNDRVEPPLKHIIAEILERAGINGQVDLRPYFHAVDTHPPAQHVKSRTICIQGTNTTASTPMRNKQWHANRFAEVGEQLAKNYDLIQLGLSGESDIPAAVDMRGKLTIRQTAEKLAGARFFIGQVGFLMHLSRMTRSVINQNFIFGVLFVIVGLVMAAFKWINPVSAAVLNVMGSLIVVFNSARLVREGEEFEVFEEGEEEQEISGAAEITETSRMATEAV